MAPTTSNVPTVVDRTLHPILTKSSSTFRDFKTERLHRFSGASLIQTSGILLNQTASTVATAFAIFHRFYHRRSLCDVDVWSTAMASVALAGKVEEDPRKMREIVTVFAHLYRRRRLRVAPSSTTTCTGTSSFISDGGANVEESKQASTLTEEEKLNVLRYVRPLSPNGPLYRAWSKALLDTENMILRELGFTLYWIPGHHPHKFILYFLRVLGLDKNREVAQRSWNYCNDSCLQDFSVRYEPEIIACAAIIMATSDCGVTTLPMKPRPWWEVFIGPSRDLDLSSVCNAVLALGDASQSEHWNAMRCIIPSLVEGGAFNDPESYIWKEAD